MNKRFLHTPSFYALLWIVLFSLAGQTSYAQQNRYNHPVFNIGFKLGANALSMNTYKAHIGEIELANLSYKNKTGFDAGLFFRINLDHFFMQPELEWGTNRQELSFSLLSGEDSWQSPTKFSINSKVLNINALVGYNIIKSGPFLFNIIAGPSFQYDYSTKYTVNSTYDFKEKTPNYNMFGILGFTVNISKVHFDIRYGICLLNTDINFNIPDSSESIKEVSIQKSKNILSFSCGLMF